MSKRKPPRRTKHNYLVSFVSHLGGAQVVSHRSISMAKPWSVKDTDDVVNKLGEWNPGYTNIVITNVFYMGRA